LAVNENMMLRRIFGRNREEGRGNRRKIHNEELYNLCSETNVIMIIKLSRMGERHAAQYRRWKSM
jgi:hypothetical protein